MEPRGIPSEPREAVVGNASTDSNAMLTSARFLLKSGEIDALLSYITLWRSRVMISFPSQAQSIFDNIRHSAGIHF